MRQNVVIVGASDKPDRYSYKAFRMLRGAGHTVIPIHPQLKEIEGVKVRTQLSDVAEAVDTVTMYVGPQLSSAMQAPLLDLKPQRVIFNPGSENPALERALQQAGIEVIEACTLVMLSTHQF